MWFCIGLPIQQFYLADTVPRFVQCVGKLECQKVLIIICYSFELPQATYRLYFRINPQTGMTMILFAVSCRPIILVGSNILYIKNMMPISHHRN